MRCCLVCLIASLAIAALAQSNRHLPGRRLTTPPTIDGVVDKEEWKEAAIASDFVDETTSKPAEFPTLVYVGYDNENIYFGFVATDPQPSLIKATEYRRQGNVEGDDRFIFIINPFGTYSGDQYTQFDINANGGANVHFAGGRAAKREWQGEWEAKARITQTGYEIEVRLPWKILRLPPHGMRTLTINFGRFIPRTNKVLLWSDIGPDERMDRNGTWTGVEIPAISSQKVVEALAYGLVGYGENEKTIANSGMDLRYQLKSNVTGLATINPDFANVESAVLGIEFSRFERLAEERRPFFVEGGGFYRFGGMSVQMFAPQRIGQIDFGAKVFGGRSDTQSIGGMVASRFEHDTTSVLRYQQLFGPRGSVTAGFINYDNAGIQNSGFSIDSIYQGPRWGGDILYSHTDDSIVGKGDRFDADLFFGDGHLQGAVGWQQISADFLPRAGFAPRKGFKGYNTFLAYSRQFPKGSLFGLGIFANYTKHDKEDGSGIYLESRDLNTDFTLRNNLEFGVAFSDSNFEGALDKIVSYFANYPSNDPLRHASLSYTRGTIDGDPYRDVSIGGNYRLRNRLSVSAALQTVRLGKVDNFQHIFGVSYEISEFRSVSGRAILVDGKTNWYLAFRQSGNFGTEYYLILGEPNADTFQKRLVLKAVIPLTWRL